MGRTAIQGGSPSTAGRRSPARQTAAASTLSSFPDAPRNSREKLLALGGAPQVISRSRSTAISARSSSSAFHQEIWSSLSSHPTCLFFIIVGACFLIGALLSATGWARRSDVLLPSPSSSNQIDLSHLHSELVALENELKQKSKRQESQSHLVDGLKNDLERLKQMKDHYASMETKMNNIETSLERFKQEFGSQLKEGLASVMKINAASNKKSSLLSETDAQKLDQIYRTYYLDNVGKIDWARAAVGGSIDPRFTSTGVNKDLRNLILSSIIPYLPSKYDQRSRPYSKPADIIIGGPESAKLGFIQSDRLQPGYCYAITGSTGNITINLPSVVEVSEIHYEHVSPEISPVVESAPRTIAVYVDGCIIDGTTQSFDDEVNAGEELYSQQEGRATAKKEPCWGRPTFAHPPSVLLGQYVFDYPNVLSQTFTMEMKEQIATRRVRFEILDNQGSDQYTCIYRLRIHGDRIEQKKVEQSDDEAELMGVSDDGNDDATISQEEL